VIACDKIICNIVIKLKIFIVSMRRLFSFLLVLILLPLAAFDLNLSLSYEHVPLAVVRSALWLSLIAFVGSFVGCFLIKRFEFLHASHSHDHDLTGVQKQHTVPVPRIGGLAIFFGMLVSFWVLSSALDATGLVVPISVFCCCRPFRFLRWGCLRISPRGYPRIFVY